MRCADCGQEVANIGAMTKHKRQECPARHLLFQYDTPDPKPAPPDEPAVNGYKPIAKIGEQIPVGFIPFSQLPDQVRILSPGMTLRLRVMARLTEGGAVVETTEFWR